MSENHIRGISTTLTLLDKALCEFDQYAHGHAVRSVLHQVRNPLSAAQRKTLAAEVAEMKSILQEIKGTLHLRASVHEADRMIVAACSTFWVSLVELEGTRLRRYGELPPGLAEYLDPRVAALNVHLRQISKIISTGGPR
ncbi:MAG: hypothetical protein LDL33_00840 [Desulfomonile sp.]|nr:hypothetical protein [Desulfomonile sp.]